MSELNNLTLEIMDHYEWAHLHYTITQVTGCCCCFATHVIVMLSCNAYCFRNAEVR